MAGAWRIPWEGPWGGAPSFAPGPGLGLPWRLLFWPHGKAVLTLGKGDDVSLGPKVIIGDNAAQGLKAAVIQPQTSTGSRILNRRRLPAAETFCLIDFASITLGAGIG